MAGLPCGRRGLLRPFRHHRRELASTFRYRFLNRMPGMSGTQAGLAHLLRHPRISTAVFGTTQMAHLKENVAAPGMSANRAHRERSRRMTGIFTAPAEVEEKLRFASMIAAPRWELRDHSTVDRTVKIWKRAARGRADILDRRSFTA